MVVDVGNTVTVIGLYDHKNLKSHWKLSSKMPRSSDECWILLRAWCEANGLITDEIPFHSL